MLRPCFLIIDREFSAGISTRKLVVETAKFNVITAYNSAEAIETLKTFSAVNAAVVDEHIDDLNCAGLVAELKKIKPDLPVVAIGVPGSCGAADFYVEPFRPEELLALLRKLQPAETEAIHQTNEALRTSETTL